MPTLTTAFEISPTECKILQLVRQKTLVFRQGLIVPFHGIEEKEGKSAVEAKARRLKEALRTHKIQVSAAILVLPKHAVTARSVFLPSTEEEELRGMVEFEAHKIIPFNVERHIVSHTVLSRKSIQGTRVLIAAVDQPIVEESLHILTHAGIEPSVVDVSSLALTNAWRREHPETPSEGLCALVNVGSVYTEITLINNGSLVTTRSALHGVNDLLESLTKVTGSSRPLELLDLPGLDTNNPEEFRPAEAPPTSPTISGRSMFQPMSADLTSASAPPSKPISSTGSAPKSPAPEINSDKRPILIANAEAQPTLSPQESTAPDPVVSLEGAEQETDSPKNKVPSTPLTPGQEEAPGPVAQACSTWVRRLALEIRRTYEFARREFEAPALSHLKLSGEGLLIPGLDQSLATILGAEVIPFSPLETIPQDPKRPSIDPLLKPTFAIATGGALHGVWPDAYPINLLPAEVLKRQERQELRLSLMLSGAMALIAIVLTYLYLSGLATYHHDKLNRYSEYNKLMNTEVKRIDDLRQKTKIIRANQRDRASALDILHAISQYPKIGPATAKGRIVLKRFRYSSENEVEIEGNAADLPDINAMVTYLDDLKVDGKKIFRKIHLKEHTPDKIPGRKEEVFQYRLICYLNEGSAKSKKGG